MRGDSSDNRSGEEVSLRISLGAGLLAVMVAGCSSVGTDADVSTTTDTHTTAATTAIAVASTTIPASTTIAVSTTLPTSTTAAPEPPQLVVVIPTEGERVTTRRYRFAGIVDPGCTVVGAGTYFAGVASDGSWTLELLLNPGANTTTFTATDPETGLTTSRAVQVSYDPPLTLRPDGLGQLEFRTPEGESVAYLVDMLGPPNADETDTTSNSPGGYERTVSWTSAGIEVVVSDDAGHSPGGAPLWLDAPGLTGWRVEAIPDGPRLETQEGIGVRSLAQAVCAAYAGSCDRESLGVAFRGNYWDASIPYLGFAFDGTGTDPTTRVTEIGTSYTGSGVDDYEAAIERLHYRARLLGTWRGTVTAPSIPPYEIELAFSQFGYRVTNLDDVTTPPLYFGPIEPCDAALGGETGSCGSWNVSDVHDNGDADGWIRVDDDAAELRGIRLADRDSRLDFDLWWTIFDPRESIHFKGTRVVSR